VNKDSILIAIHNTKCEIEALWADPRTDKAAALETLYVKLDRMYRLLGMIEFEATL
jgi:hypothetical protein